MKTITLRSGLAGWIAPLLAALVLTSILPGQIRDTPPVLGGDRDEPSAALKEVPFLGISTHRVDPALAAKMKLPRDTGLVVARILAGSPADGVLKPHDLLTQLDDQVLVEPRQLGVLVRSRKEGADVTLTLFRAGKQQVVRVKLGKKQMPPLPEREVPAL